jgi:glycosyltransferase involved in cell wall biosynthesis
VHVALNLMFLVPGETGGMEVYARELIPRLARLPGLRVTALVSRAAAGAGLGVDTAVLAVDSRNRIEWVRGEQQHVPRAARRLGADIVHSLGSTAPVWGAFRRVTTIHDLNYKLVAESHFGLRGLGMRALVPAAAHRSHRIIVDAASTREDLATHLSIAPERVDVVPLGVSPVPPVTPTPEAELRARLGLGSGPVLLSVSAKRPHKNLARLLDAVAQIPDERRPVLVLPGYATPHEAELRERAAALGLGDSVVFCHWLPAEDLEGLYALAAAFAFPSLYEGFGLPVLEAMARGVPVATSVRGSLAEVAGAAALVFDPEDPAAIRAAIERLLVDRELAATLRAAGRERAAAFTWERTARLTAAAYERALSA